jgi:hypothetical protein
MLARFTGVVLCGPVRALLRANGQSLGRLRPPDGRQNPDIRLHELRDYAVVAGAVVRPSTGSWPTPVAADSILFFDIVLCWKHDRLGRSFRHLLNTLVEFESLGIALVSIRESLDLSVPGPAWLMFQIIGAMAEFERELIRERVTAGMRHAKSRGVHIGRPSVQVDAAKIRELREPGLGWRDIAKEPKVSVGSPLQHGSHLPDLNCGTESTRLSETFPSPWKRVRGVSINH